LNEAATSASSQNDLTVIAQTRMTYGTHETNQKALDHTYAENRANFFRMHVLRGRGLTGRD